MLPRSLRSLCVWLTAMITISIIDQSSCHHTLSRRGTTSFSAFSHHRFARRSSPRSANQLEARSVAINTTPSLLKRNDAASAPVGHWRRSVDFDQSNNDLMSQSLEEQREQADRMWEEFVESTEGEDPNLYSDCDSDDGTLTDSVLLGTNNSGKSQPLTSTSLSSGNKSTQKSPPQGQQSGKSNNYDQNSTKTYSTGTDHDGENQVYSAEESKKEKEAAKKKKAKAEAEAQKQQEAEQAKKEQEAAEAQKEQEAAAEAKKEEEAKKAQEEAEAKKEEEAKKAQEEAEAQKAKKHKDTPRLTNLKKVHGSSVTVGTAEHDHDETYASPANSEEHSGDATFFAPDVGACGKLNTSSDYIVAVSHLLYDSFPSDGGNPNTNAICGKKIKAHYHGKEVVVTVTDRCEGCSMYSLDFTEAAFQELGSKEEGRLYGMTWTFI